MAFVPRTFEEIRDDMIAFMELHTDVTDYEIGSAVRTLIEAAALEDDEQYFQMVQLLDAFRISTSSGQDLDERLAEYGQVRLQPAASAGDVVFRDTLLVTDFVAFNIVASAGSVIVTDSSSFPTSGFPITIRIGEGTTAVEDVSVTANDTGTGTLTLSGTTTYAHDAGERVSLVDGLADKTISPGVRPQVPATGTQGTIVFVTTESGTLVNGNYQSTPISARAEVPGRAGNVGAGKITEFASSAPFSGAAVTNISKTGGGRDLETDAAFRDRGLAALQSLSKGTVLALREGTLGVEDPVSGQRVTTASVIESFANNEVIVYVDDGTGFTPDTIGLSRSTLTSSEIIGASTFTVADSSGFPEEGFVVVSPESGAQIEVLAFSGVNHTTNVISLVGTAANAHDSGDEIALVDVVEDAAEAGQNHFQLAGFPVVRDALRVWLDDTGAGTPVLQILNTDYVVNRGTGQIEFIGSGVSSGSVVVASYTYYTNLIAQVQKVIDGDLDDPTNFPGIRAGGVKVVVETPAIRRISVRLAITAAAGVQEDSLIPQVQEAVEGYINSLGVGENVILFEIIEQAMAVTGMFDVTVSDPLINTVILENELPVPYDSAGNSLVVVT